MRLTVGNLKGGSGKTTSSVFVSLWLASRGERVRVLLVDADPEQPQCVQWSQEAGEAWPLDRVIVYPCAMRDLARRVRPLMDDFDHVVIDTGAKNPDLLRQALSLSDLLLVPVQPTGSDLPELHRVFEIAADVDSMRPDDRPLLAFTLLTRVPTNDGGADERDARKLLESWDMAVLAARVREIKGIKHARGSVPDDLSDYKAVGLELLEEAK